MTRKKKMTHCKGVAPSHAYWEMVNVSFSLSIAKMLNGNFKMILVIANLKLGIANMVHGFARMGHGIVNLKLGIA